MRVSTGKEAIPILAHSMKWGRRSVGTLTMGISTQDSSRPRLTLMQIFAARNHQSTSLDPEADVPREERIRAGKKM